MHGGDVVHHWGAGVVRALLLGEVMAEIAFPPVAHDAVGPGVFGIPCIGGVAGTGAIVMTGMQQAQGMPDFMVHEPLLEMVLAQCSFLAIGSDPDLRAVPVDAWVGACSGKPEVGSLPNNIFPSA